MMKSFNLPQDYACVFRKHQISPLFHEVVVVGGRLETTCSSSEVLVFQTSSRAVQENLWEEAARLGMLWKEMAAGSSVCGLGIFCGLQQPAGQKNGIQQQWSVMEVGNDTLLVTNLQNIFLTY